ncbi:MAG TPA: NADH-quinone oxidoreductase subunit N [Mucilaginibacter sp.]
MYELINYITGQLNSILDSMICFMPEVYLSVLFLLVLITDLIFGRNADKLCRIVAFAGMLLVIFKDLQQVAIVLEHDRFLFNDMLLLNHSSLVFKFIIDVLAFVLLLYFGWDDQLKSHRKRLADLYTITIGSILGLHLMVMAINMLSIYVAIEMVSIASYLMVAYRSENAFSTEAGLKYVLFGAACSAIMLYGISLLYGFTGSLYLLSSDFALGASQANPLAISFAVSLVLVGIGFKLSFVPMHFWVPDVYQGAPTPVTAYLSTLPKIAAFGLLINFLTPFIFIIKPQGADLRLYLSIIGIVTMIGGNFAAVMQNNVKRMLAYSSIGHTGFALMAIVTFTAQGISALSYYLVVYGLANIGALALATYFVNITGAEDVEGYKGLGLKYPAASVCFVIVLISLTGLPVTAGFTGKLFVFSAIYAVYQQNHDIWLMLLMVTGALTTVVSLFYYIKIPLYLFLKRTEATLEPRVKSTNIVIFSIIIAILLLLLGVFPDRLLAYL